MKILVLGGMHGNEPLGLEVVRLIRNNPIFGVDTDFANERAIKKNVRFVNQDLNRSFPGAIAGKNYEQKRAAELLKLCKNYDIVFDFHNTHCPNNDSSFVGSKAKNQLYDISGWLGLKRVIIVDYDCINKYATNCISIEISLKSKRMDANFWYRKIKSLSKMKQVPKQKNIKKYKFVYRMTIKDKEKYNLDKLKLEAFKQIDKELANKLGVQSPAYPIFIADKYTPYNYGGLLNKI